MAIPKIIHQIWLGDKPIPEEFKEYQRTWQKNHPKWDYRLWTDKNLPPLLNRKLFEQQDTLAGQSDILRYELLFAFGGVYVDIDTISQKPLDPLIENKEAFLAWLSRLPRLIGIGIIGAAPRHPFVRDLISFLPRNCDRQKSLDPSRKTGNFYVQSILKNHPEVTIFPQEYFYPYSWKDPLGKIGPTRTPMPFTMPPNLGLAPIQFNFFGMKNYKYSLIDFWVNSKK